ncbi:MAG: WxcM-like domain-containing protein [Bacteroidales bacterium]
MSEIKIIKGEIYTDARGVIKHVNDFDLEGVCRTYAIHQSDPSVVRAWHGHQFEKKYFFVVKGSFTFGFVKIDDWENPSDDLVPTIIKVDASKESQVICIPEGYANAVKANEPDSIVIVYSGKRMDVAVLDSWRWDKDKWVDWSKY